MKLEGTIMLESGDIISKFAKENNVDPSSLPGYNFIFGNKEKTMMKFLVEVIFVLSTNFHFKRMKKFQFLPTEHSLARFFTSL